MRTGGNRGQHGRSLNGYGPGDDDPLDRPSSAKLVTHGKANSRTDNGAGSGGGNSSSNNGSGRFRNFISLKRNKTTGSNTAATTTATKSGKLKSTHDGAGLSTAANNGNVDTTDSDGFEENPRIPLSPGGTPPKKIWEGAYKKFLARNNTGTRNGGSDNSTQSSSPTSMMLAQNVPLAPSLPPPALTAVSADRMVGHSSNQNFTSFRDGNDIRILQQGPLHSERRSASFSVLPGTRRLVTMKRPSSNSAKNLDDGLMFPRSSTDSDERAGKSEAEQPGREGSVRGGKLFHSLFVSSSSTSIKSNQYKNHHHQSMDALDVPMRKGIEKSSSPSTVPSPSSRNRVRKDAPSNEKVNPHRQQQQHGFAQQTFDGVGTLSVAMPAGTVPDSGPPPIPRSIPNFETTPVSTMGTIVTTSVEEDDLMDHDQLGKDEKNNESCKNAATNSLDDLLASACATPESQRHMTISVGNMTGMMTSAAGPTSVSTPATRSVSMGGLTHPMINEGVMLPPSTPSLHGMLLQPRVSSSSQNNYSYNSLHLINPPQTNIGDSSRIPPPNRGYPRTTSGGSWSHRVPSSPVHQVGLALEDSDSASASTDDVQSTPLSQQRPRPIHVLESTGNLDDVLFEATSTSAPPTPTLSRSSPAESKHLPTSFEKKKAFTNFHNASRFAHDSTSPFLGADDESSVPGNHGPYFDNIHAMLSRGGGRSSDQYQHSVIGDISGRTRTTTFHNRLSSMPHLVSTSLPLETVDEQNISIHNGMRLLKPIQGTESWQQGRRYLITPAVLSASSLSAINKLSGSKRLNSSEGAEAASAFGVIDLGEALMTYIGEKHHLSLGKWSSCRLVLRQNYLFEYDVNSPITGPPRGFCHLQHAVAYPNQDFQDALELRFYASPCAKADQRVLMIRVQQAMNAEGRQLDNDERNHWISCLNNAASLRIEDLWDFDEEKPFGDGRYAAVYRARRKTNDIRTQKDNDVDYKPQGGDGEYHCALKIVDKNQFWRRVVKGRERADTLVRELAVQSTMTANCTKISSFVRIRGVFETSDNFVIELELLEGKDLFEFLSSKGSLSEKEASLVMYDILTSLEAMNRAGLAHRDVKPANILMAHRDDEPVAVKLGDFGMAAFVGVDGMVRGRCGTPGYVAPEILSAGTRSGYSCICDMFSAGVTMYVMLSGYEPFYGESEKELIEANKRAIVDFPSSDWDCISSEAIDLLRRMIQSDPQDRISPKEALGHEWIRRYCSVKETTLSQSLQSSVAERHPVPPTDDWVGGACTMS